MRYGRTFWQVHFSRLTFLWYKIWKMNTFNIRIDAKLFYGVLLEPWDKWSWNHRTLMINNHSSTVLMDGRVIYHYQKKTRSFKRQYQAWKMDFQSESKILFTTVTFTWRLFEGLRGNHVVTRKSEKKFLSMSINNKSRVLKS